MKRRGWAVASHDWIVDCRKWRGRVLDGRLGHWCFDWDLLPVDETCDEIDACTCYSAAEIEAAKREKNGG